MYLSDFHAHICIRSKSRNPRSASPAISLPEILSARYVLFNRDPEKLSYPLRLEVFKSRVDALNCTDFYNYLVNEYPSIEYVDHLAASLRTGQFEKAHILIHDEFDIIKFLLIYSD